MIVLSEKGCIIEIYHSYSMLAMLVCQTTYTQTHIHTQGKKIKKDKFRPTMRATIGKYYSDKEKKKRQKARKYLKTHSSRLYT